MEFWLRKQSNEDEENLCVWFDSFLNSLFVEPVRFISVRFDFTLGLGIHSSVFCQSDFVGVIGLCTLMDLEIFPAV